MKNHGFASVRIRSLFLALCIGTTCSYMQAETITPEQAKTAAENWISRGNSEKPFRPESGVVRIESFRNKSGEPLFHVAHLMGGGFIVLSTDNGIHPVIAFSSTGQFEADTHSILWKMLNFDMAGRKLFAEVNREQQRSGIHPLLLSTSDSVSSPEREWAALLNQSVSLAEITTRFIDDLRVAPLVQTTWGQSVHSTTLGGLFGKPCFNYYTPRNYVCGCVATAFAQILRYHRWPRTPVYPESFMCTVDGNPTTLTMQGGTYRWYLMPENTSSASAEERMEIGKLCSDVGIACEMQYAKDGSGAYMRRISETATSCFGYRNACLYSDYYGIESYAFNNLILSDLDAAMPVALGIRDSERRSGHAIVADGYGYISNRLYVHLNLGWDGKDNAWYALPNIGASISFNLVDEIVYNIFPTQEDMEILSGRVLNFEGKVLSGIPVHAVSKDGCVSVSGETGKNGIYALFLKGNKNYTVTVGGEEREVYVGLDYANSWGNDFMIW